MLWGETQDCARATLFTLTRRLRVTFSCFPKLKIHLKERDLKTFEDIARNMMALFLTRSKEKFGKIVGFDK